jgi:hypothetical protein
MTLLDTKQAAKKLRLARRTLEKWRTEGRGPEYRKHGDLVFYEERDLEQWSDAQRRTPTAEVEPQGANRD